MGQCLSNAPIEQAGIQKYQTSWANSQTSFEDLEMEFWTVEDVYEWLSTLKNGSFIIWAGVFKNKEFNGLTLRGMNRNYLKKVGMSSDDISYIMKERDMLIQPLSTPVTTATKSGSSQMTQPSMATTNTLSIGIPITPLYNDESNNGEPAATPAAKEDVDHLKIKVSSVTPEPEEKESPLHYFDELDRNLLNELVEIALTAPSFHKSISQYQQEGLLSPKKFNMMPGGGGLPKISCSNLNQMDYQISLAQRLLIKHSQLQLNIDAAPFVPGKKKSQSAPNLFKLSPINEIKDIQTLSAIAEHQRNKNWKRYGARGNIEISRNLTENIIPNRIKGKIPNLFEYMDKVTRLHKDNQHQNELRVFNYDFYDKDTNEMLYCIAEVTFGAKSSFKWKMRDKIYTKTEIMKEIGNDCNIPQSWRNHYELQFVQEKSEQKMVEDMITSYGRKKIDKNHIMSKCKWTKRRVLCKKNHKQRLTLAVNQEQFKKNVREYIQTQGDNVNTIPILVFDESEVHIEYVYIVRIVQEPDIDIGLSYKVMNNQVEISRIYVDSMDILNAHLLLKPDDCDCLNGFKSIIDVLKIGNPDDNMNKIKDLKNKWAETKRELRELKRNASSTADNNGLDEIKD